MARRRITITRSGGGRTVHRGRSRSPKQRSGGGMFTFFKRWFYGPSSGSRRYRKG